MSELKNDLLLRAIKREKIERVPVWIMRQAGRYLPSFQKLRSEHTFEEICASPTLICKASLLPLDVFDLDGCIIFSDILVVLQALGMGVKMVSGKGPVINPSLSDPNDIATMKVVNTSVLQAVYDGMKLLVEQLDGRCPVIGFAGAPWTLMSYLIEGGSSNTFSKARIWLYKHPKESEQLLSLLSTVVAKHLEEQVKSGARVLQLFESNAFLLSLELFRKFSLPYIRYVAKYLRKNLQSCPPLIIFARGMNMGLLEELSAIFDVISIDWTMDQHQVRLLCGDKICLQGNLDPCALFADPSDVTRLTHAMIDAFGPKGLIANLGHGIYPDTPVSSVEAFVNAVHSYSNVCLET